MTEGLPELVGKSPVIAIKRRCDFGNLHFAEKTEGLVSGSGPFIAIKRSVKKWILHHSQAKRPPRDFGGAIIYLFIRVRMYSLTRFT